MPYYPPGSSAAPPLHAIQFNNPLGVLDGSSDFIFDNNRTGFPAVGLGSLVVDLANWDYNLIVSDFVEEDLSTSGWAFGTIGAWNTWKHTGASPGYVYSLDVEETIDATSTGDFDYVIPIVGAMYNNGSGDITNFWGFNPAVVHSGSGTVTDCFGVVGFYLATGTVTRGAGAAILTSTGSNTTDHYGLLIVDQSGIGDNDSLNILSQGDGTSLNQFEGSIQVGAASEAAGVVTPGTGPNALAVGNYAVPGFLVNYPGSAAESVGTNPYIFGVNGYLSGSYGSHNVNGVSNIVGFAKTAGAGFTAFIGEYVQVTISEDSIDDNINTYGLSFDVNNYAAGDALGLTGVTGTVINYSAANVSAVYGAQNAVAHYGDGAIASVYGLYSYIYSSAIGNITDCYGIYIEGLPPDGAGVITNAYGIYIADQSAVGSTIALNILSEGDGTSLNQFEGSIQVGAASEAAGVVTPGTGPNVLAVGNYAVPGFKVSNPGGSINSTTAAAEYTLNVNALHSGALVNGREYGGQVIGVSGETSTVSGTAGIVGQFVEAFLSEDSTGSIGTLKAALFGATSYGNTGISGTITGADFYAQNFGTGTVGAMYGMSGYIWHGGSSNIANGYGLYFYTYIDGSGNLTNSYGIYIDGYAPGSTGDITNAYGIYIEDQSAVATTTHRNIWSAGANSNNVFEGTVSGSKEPRATKTSDYVIAATDYGTQFDNIGAAGTVIFTLPAATVGRRFGFCVAASQILRVVAPASTSIAIGGANSAAAGNIESSTTYSYVELEAISTTQWVAKTSTGTWVVT